MPRLSYFYGIAIYMYYGDHFPPHIHARYAESEAQIAIATGEYVAGSLPPRASRLVEEWRRLHLDELVEAWVTVHDERTPGTIEPLP
jgi:Domain of unknown function (DUF4160)